MRARLQTLLTEYGPVALAVWFGLFLLTWAGFWAAIHFGWQPQGMAAGAGALGAAYVATQLTKPLRLGATLLLTPLLARLVRRQARPVPADPAPGDSAPGE